MSEPAALLLRYLDARVRRDQALPGIAGRVCVGVRGPRGPRYWIADFAPAVGPKGGAASTRFSDTRPTGCTVTVGLDADGARALLALPVAGPPMQLVAGDRKLLARFVERYLRDVSPLQSRIGALTGAAGTAGALGAPGGTKAKR
jgi:hypothetical protein